MSNVKCQMSIVKCPNYAHQQVNMVNQLLNCQCQLSKSDFVRFLSTWTHRIPCHWSAEEEKLAVGKQQAGTYSLYLYFYLCLYFFLCLCLYLCLFLSVSENVHPKTSRQCGSGPLTRIAWKFLGEHFHSQTETQGKGTATRTRTARDTSSAGTTTATPRVDSGTQRMTAARASDWSVFVFVFVTVFVFEFVYIRLADLWEWQVPWSKLFPRQVSQKKNSSENIVQCFYTREILL